MTFKVYSAMALVPLSSLAMSKMDFFLPYVSLCCNVLWIIDVKYYTEAVAVARE